MDADNASTPRAFVFLPLVFEEGIYSFPFNLVKILNHAHTVVGSVPLVQGLQSLAGEIRTFEAKVYTIVA